MIEVIDDWFVAQQNNIASAFGDLRIPCSRGIIFGLIHACHAVKPAFTVRGEHAHSDSWLGLILLNILSAVSIGSPM